LSLGELYWLFALLGEAHEIE